MIPGIVQSQMMGAVAGGAPALDSYGFTTGSPDDGYISEDGQSYDVNTSNSNFYNAITGVLLSGKVYCEFQLQARSKSSYHVGLGVMDSSNNAYISTGGAGCFIDGSSGGYFNDGTETTDASYEFGIGDRVGIAFDASTKELWVSINGSWVSGDPGSGTSPTLTAGATGGFYFYCGVYTQFASAPAIVEVDIYPNAAIQNYTAPSGFSPYQT